MNCTNLVSLFANPSNFVFNLLVWLAPCFALTSSRSDRQSALSSSYIFVCWLLVYWLLVYSGFFFSSITVFLSKCFFFFHFNVQSLGSWSISILNFTLGPKLCYCRNFFFFRFHFNICSLGSWSISICILTLGLTPCCWHNVVFFFMYLSNFSKF